LVLPTPYSEDSALIFMVSTSDDVVSRKDVTFWGPKNDLNFNLIFLSQRIFWANLLWELENFGSEKPKPRDF